MKGKNPYLVRDLLLISLALGLLFFVFLGNRPLAAPDEGRYVEVPREMVATGDYLTPHLNGLKYFEKPPLLYWVQTIPIHLFGIQEWAMRLPVAFLALFGCLLTYFFTQHLYDRRTGLFATGILGTSLLYNVLGRLLTLDMGVSVFLTGTLFSFLAATEEPAPKKRRLWMIGAACFAACSMLSKGLIGIAVPGMIIFCWFLLTNQWRILPTLFLPSAIGVFLLVAAPWHILVSLKNPGFFDFYFIHEHFERYLTTVHRRHQPLWFFIPVVLLGLFPWTSLLFKSLFQRYSKKPRELFFFLWFLVPFIFFSISHSKLIPYILPVFPALAVLMARRIGEGASFKAEILTHSLFSMVLGVAVMVVIGDVDPDLKMILKTHLVALSGVLGGSAILVPILFWKYGGTIKAFGGILITGIVVVFIVIMAAPLVPRLSIKPLANIFLDKMPKDTDVFTYITYYQDLPPYLGRTVTVVEWQGELAFGMNDDPAQTQIVTHEMFEQAWRTKPRVCVFTRQNRYENLATYSWFTHTVLGRHDGQVLACRNDFEQIRHQD